MVPAGHHDRCHLGLGAVTFYIALKYTAEFLLRYLADYHHPTPSRGGRQPRLLGLRCPWAIPLVTTGGALLSALLVAKFGPEATGRLAPTQPIKTAHTDPRAIRFRAVLVKMVASALTIGSDWFSRPRRPTAQISAGFGSLYTRRLDLSDEDGRIAVALEKRRCGRRRDLRRPAWWSSAGRIDPPIATTSTTAACCPVSSPRARRMRCSGLSWASIRCSATSTPSTGLKRPGRCSGSWCSVQFAAGVGYPTPRIFRVGGAERRIRLPAGPVLKPAIGQALGLLGLLIPSPQQRLRGPVAADRTSLLAIPLWIVVSRSPRSSRYPLSSAAGGSGSCSVRES